MSNGEYRFRKMDGKIMNVIARYVIVFTLSLLFTIGLLFNINAYALVGSLETLENKFDMEIQYSAELEGYLTSHNI